MRKKVTTTDILARKAGTKITSVTAYDYSMAKLVDAAGIDIILVGDSLGMVILGYPDTTRVTLDDMVHLFPELTPRFAKVYADMGTATRDAVACFCEEVQAGRFPAREHCY